MILLGALVLDLLLGEPRNAWHPVAWVGGGLARGFARAPRDGRARPLVAGGAIVVSTAAVAAGLACLVSRARTPFGIAGVGIEAWCLKCAFSLRGLVEAARGVEGSLRGGDLLGARQQVGTHLVSRDTTDLDEGGVASAAVESVAENLTDSVVAPVFWYLVLGLPGAWAYRVINTADAMVGYRTGVLEYLGKVAARLDDVLSFIPARIAGLAIVAGAAVASADAREAWRTLGRDRSRPASPNAGWTMAPMAGALGVTLEKARAYRLGTGPAPSAETIDRSLRVMTAASVLIIAAAVVVERRRR